MDMQNVSNLTIPEGEVKAIHDSNSQLLWGRVNYNTKYAGDAYQQTYSGKNLFDGLFTQGTYYNAGIANRIITSQSPKLTTGQMYTLSFTGLPTNFRFAVNLSSNPIRAGEGAPLAYDSGWKTATFSFSPQGDYYFAIVMSKLSGADIVPSEVANMKWQLEIGTATAYEPYVGGIPAPNPDYPQDTQVVTGTQTITLSDGVNNHNYTVNLGSIELCKIGTHQDYIYKSGDDWYIHKESEKVIYNGSENWVTRTGKSHTFQIPISTSVQGLSNYFTNILAANFDIKPGMYAGNSGVLIISYPDMADLTAFTTWLGSHNLVFYEILSVTPADTKITDSTLISQLDAVHQFLTRYGYNATVSGNLPIIIDRTAL